MANIKSINFVPEGSEPKTFRRTSLNVDVEQVITAAKTFPSGKSMVVDVSGAKKSVASSLCYRLRKSVDDKKFEVSHTATQVIIIRKAK